MSKTNNSNHKQTDTLHGQQRQRCEVWTRVMGYYRPVSQFNAGKKSEHKERVHFQECPTPQKSIA